MLRMFRTINGQVEQIQKPENGSWLCLSDPTDVELANVSMETGVDLADLRAPLDDEERSRVDVEDDYTMIIVDIPTVEERGGRDWYETIPLSIIITQSAIITVCMQDTPVLHPFMEGTIRGFNTYMKTRFILQILYRNATMYLRYLRIIDRESDKLELSIWPSTLIGFYGFPHIMGCHHFLNRSIFIQNTDLCCISICHMRNRIRNITAHFIRLCKIFSVVFLSFQFLK